MSFYGGSDAKNQGESSYASAVHKKRSQNLFFILGYFFIMLIAFCVISLVPPIQGILNKKEQVIAAQLEGMKKIPDLEKNILRLESQLAILSSESVGARLDKLESLTSNGKLSVEQVRTVSQLNQDLAIVKGYMFKDLGSVVELKELQNNYGKMVADQGNYATKESLNSQISYLQWALGLSLTFFGLLFTVAFGSWWFVGRRYPSEVLPTRPVGQVKHAKNSNFEEEDK